LFATDEQRDCISLLTKLPDLLETVPCPCRTAAGPYSTVTINVLRG
jgi:hypothetical protein